MKNKSVLFFLASEDFNEVEFNTVKSAVERANFNLFIASDAFSLCTGDKGLKIRPDVSAYNMKAINFGGLVIIGGEGIRKYWNNKNLLKLVNGFVAQRKPVGAICMAPVVLARAGVLKEKKAVCYPPVKAELEKEGVEFRDEPVVMEGNIVTARDYLSAEEFAGSMIYLLKK